MKLIDLLSRAVEMRASDLFVVAGSGPICKVNGRFVPLDTERIMPAESEQMVRESYVLGGHRSMENLEMYGDDDFSFSLPGISRFRCNVYRQRGSYAANYRVVYFGLPDPERLGIPPQVMSLTRHLHGMVLVTGPAGSGKSTTLACLVDRINTTRQGHIVTIEDPIEYLHPHKQSIISQREVPGDVCDFARALRGALRQAPDAIMLGEMRDNETMQIAITAAETGHLVLSSLHTVGASKTIDRMIDGFPASQQQQIRVQLSMVLRAVVSQHLVPTVDGTLQAVFEVMQVTPAIQNLIRDGKAYQIDNTIFTSAMAQGSEMLSCDQELLRLYQQKRITKETAITYAINPETLRKRLI